MKIKMIKSPDRWVLCPICGNKTRTKIRPDTILENFPLFCPKCKQETLISAKDLNVAVIPQQIAESAGAVNGQDERAAPAVDSPARLCWQVIKGRTARSAAAPHHYRKKPCTSLRQRGFLPFSSFQMCPGRA